jgi:Type I restriction modification DNA specificity domain
LILRDTEEGNIPVCSHSAENNGVGAFVAEIPERKIFDCERSICLADRGTFNATIQTADYYIGTRVKSLVLKEFINASVKSLLFIATVINNESYRYSYGRNCTDRVEEIIIKLPATADVQPDWQYMNDFIENLENLEREGKGSLKDSLNTENRKADKSVDITDWEDFVVDDLFEVKKGKRLTKHDQTEGTTPYIGAISSNNGCANYIGQNAIHEGNTISLSYNGSVAEAFYQPEPFWATDDVNVLYPKDKDKFNLFVALFICAILRQEKYRYSYGRKWILETMRSTKIKLPAKNNKPDWILWSIM